MTNSHFWGKKLQLCENNLQLRDFKKSQICDINILGVCKPDIKIYEIKKNSHLILIHCFKMDIFMIKSQTQWFVKDLQSRCSKRFSFSARDEGVRESYSPFCPFLSWVLVNFSWSYNSRRVSSVWIKPCFHFGKL